jgi:hypothetical protein
MPASLADIDRNFAVETACNLPVRFYPARVSPFSIHGLYDPQAGAPYRRLPADVAAATNDGVSSLALHTSGGRVRFKTDSPYVVLKACMPHVDLMPHMTLVGSSGLDVYVTTPDGERYQGSCKISWGNDAAIRATEEHGYVNEVHFDPTLSGMKDVTVNMPLYNCLDELYIGLAPDAKLEAAEGYRDLPPTVYYGSSITQGGCASRPGNNYCAILSRAFGVDRVCKCLEFRNYLLTHPKLVLERESAPAYCGISDSRHSDAAACHGGMVIEQLLRRSLSGAHGLEGSRPDRAVLQFDRSDLIWCK